MKPCFVLDNSVVMRWFFGDGMENDLEYATRVLDAVLEKLDIGIAPIKATEKIAAEVLQLARRYALSSYDASYLNLALRENLPLATLDSDLLEATRLAAQKFKEGEQAMKGKSFDEIVVELLRDDPTLAVEMLNGI